MCEQAFVLSIMGKIISLISVFRRKARPPLSCQHPLNHVPTWVSFCKALQGSSTKVLLSHLPFAVGKQSCQTPGLYSH